MMENKIPSQTCKCCGVLYTEIGPVTDPLTDNMMYLCEKCFYSRLKKSKENKKPVMAKRLVDMSKQIGLTELEWKVVEFVLEHTRNSMGFCPYADNPKDGIYRTAIGFACDLDPKELVALERGLKKIKEGK